MTPKIIWSAFTLTLLSLLNLPETSVSIYRPDKDREKFQDKFPRFASKNFKTPNLFVKTSPSVFQTPSLHPSIYGNTSEQTTTSPHQAFEDSVDQATVSTATDNENDRNLFGFLPSLAHAKQGWKKYLVHLYECNDPPTQSPPSSNPTNDSTMHPSTESSSSPSTEPSSYLSVEPSVYPSTVPSTVRSTEPSSNPSMKPSPEPSIEPSISSLPSSSNPPTSIPSISKAPSDEPSMEPSYVPSSSTTIPTNSPTNEPTNQPTNEPSTEPSNIPTNEPTNEPSTEPTSSLSVSPQPTSPVEKYHTFEWKVNTIDIDRTMEKKDEIAQGLKTYLSHLLRCNEAKVQNVKLTNSTGELLVKGVCFGLRKSCAINLSKDTCNDNSLIDDFVAQRMLEISSSFDYELDLSVSFDFDSDDISVVPSFLSELIEAGSRDRRALANSNGPPEPPEVNNEATLTVQKGVGNSTFQNEVLFQQHAIKFDELIFVSKDNFSITESNSSDDSNRESLYYGAPNRTCGKECADEDELVKKIFSFYNVSFNDTIDACFWDDINCIDDSVTQIFLRKYWNNCFC